MDRILVNDYECSKKSYHEHDIEKCSRNFKSLTLNNIVGKGSFGTVYTASGTLAKNNNKVNVAVKVIKKIDLDDAIYESEFSYFMSEAGLGPKIYDSFYYKGRGTFNKGNNTQIIVMESMENSADKKLDNDSLPLVTRLSIVSQMYSILNQMILKYGLMCTDIKPGNYLANTKIKDKPIVKIIDFGNDFCEKENKLDLKLILGFTLASILIYILVREWISFDESIYVFFADPLNNLGEIVKHTMVNSDLQHAYINDIFELKKNIKYYILKYIPKYKSFKDITNTILKDYEHYKKYMKPSFKKYKMYDPYHNKTLDVLKIFSKLKRGSPLSKSLTRKRSISPIQKLKNVIQKRKSSSSRKKRKSGKKCSSKSKYAQNSNYICNPKSGRWVKKNGAIGKKLLR